MSYDSGSNYKYPDQKTMAEAIKVEIKSNKEYEIYCKHLENELAKLKEAYQRLYDAAKLICKIYTNE